MEDLAMWRQLIGQVQELLRLQPRPPFLHQPPLLLSNPQHQSSPPPPPAPAPPPPPYRARQNRRRYELNEDHNAICYFLNLDESSGRDDCDSFIMKAGKPATIMFLEPGKPPPTKKTRTERTRGKLTGTGTSDSTEIMEQQIWKKFPEDLFEHVIARLPIATFFRFRSVCRKWDSLLTSPSFSQQCYQVKQTQPWFYAITHENINTGAMYDPTLKKWHHPTDPPFITKLIVLPVASASGLVCFLDIGHQVFFVCNPLTKSFKELPARSVNVWSRVAVGMTHNSNGYKILWVGYNGEYDVYDSTKSTWAGPGSIPSNVTLPLALNLSAPAISINGILYFMRSDPYGIVSYEMETGLWNQYIVPVPLHLSDHALAECRGRIMLVGLLTKNAATCVCVWELQKMTLLWNEVDRMPNEWCLEFYGKHVTMSCLGNKDLLMLSIRSRQMNRLVTYNISTKEWLKVPPCVLPPGRKRPFIACGTAFYPCLTALA